MCAASIERRAPAGPAHDASRSQSQGITHSGSQLSNTLVCVRQLGADRIGPCQEHPTTSFMRLRTVTCMISLEAELRSGAKSRSAGAENSVREGRMLHVKLYRSADARPKSSEMARSEHNAERKDQRNLEPTYGSCYTRPITNVGHVNKAMIFVQAHR